MLIVFRPSFERGQRRTDFSKNQILTRPIVGVFLFGAKSDALIASLMDQDADS